MSVLSYDARDMENDETAVLLGTLSGGTDVLAFYEGKADFSDAEVVGLTLDRTGESRLVLRVTHGQQWAAVTFFFDRWIDVDLKGFSRQNVINRLILRRSGERKTEDWELGAGAEPGEFEIVLWPCYGAYGTIRAGITKIEFLGES